MTIAGFNDPRWFGDDNKDNAAKQTPAAEAFNRAYAGRHVPDVVVSHEPGAVEKVESAGVLVNGHLHTDQLEGNRIGVGTFTGGGTVSHFVQDAEKKDGTGDPGELAGAALRVRHRGVRPELHADVAHPLHLPQPDPGPSGVRRRAGDQRQHDPAGWPSGSTRSCAEGSGLAVTPVAEPPATPDAGPTPLTAATGRKPSRPGRGTTATVAAERLNPPALEGTPVSVYVSVVVAGLQPRRAIEPCIGSLLRPDDAGRGSSSSSSSTTAPPTTPGPARRARRRARRTSGRPRPELGLGRRPRNVGIEAAPASTSSSSTRTTGSAPRRWSGCTDGRRQRRGHRDRQDGRRRGRVPEQLFRRNVPHATLATRR